MIEDTLRRIETQLERIPVANMKRREELGDLIKTLRGEVLKLSETATDQAESITRFAELSTHEATREDGSARLRDLSREGLAASVEGFEASHPQLVEIVNAICLNLANLGI